LHWKTAKAVKNSATAINTQLKLGVNEECCREEFCFLDFGGETAGVRTYFFLPADCLSAVAWFFF
jgi:hypothetical protein